MSWTTSKSFEKPFDKFPNDKSVKILDEILEEFTRRGQSYKLMKDHVLFYKESVVYPYVNFERKGKNYFICRKMWYVSYLKLVCFIDVLTKPSLNLRQQFIL